MLTEPLFWILTAASLATASAPALMRSISKTKAIAITAIWAILTGSSAFFFGLLPALATALVSLLLGLLLFALSLVISGIKSMPNQRFEDRKP
ncbi:MAG TPA: hypothetical protein ENL07_09300 [Chlorobaculum parvum]|uniref:Uncharacterized protein n=1 Tax=Chlorobaculum parvum TaxID=274539 RepID=A0A7C5DJF1_9CHLB|nr:hypothetical protein [Chlorobaculum parvum]